MQVVDFYEAYYPIKALYLSTEARFTGLNLITCTGNLTQGTNDFDKRIVVFAEQL